MEAVIDGLVREYECRKDEVGEAFDTIYIGGGTPSVVPVELLERLVSRLPVDGISEFTIEANPDNISSEIVAAWQRLGINRVSLGVQTFNDEVLKSLGRRHTSRQAVEAIYTIHSAGITNISADLIYGLPGIDLASWEQDLETLLSTPVTHMSAYCLTYNEGTMLFKMLKRGRVVQATDEEIEMRFNALRRISAARGFEHYEISNFAKPGFRSRHNSSYWNPLSRWLGIGPSAHSFDGRIRRIDIPDIKTWLQELPCPCEIDSETELDLINDNIVTGLRTLDGLSIDTIPAKYREKVIELSRPYINDGAMSLEDGHLKIDPLYWLMSDAYIRELIIIE